MCKKLKTNKNAAVRRAKRAFSIKKKAQNFAKQIKNGKTTHTYSCSKA